MFLASVCFQWHGLLSALGMQGRGAGDARGCAGSGGSLDLQRDLQRDLQPELQPELQRDLPGFCFLEVSFSRQLSAAQRRRDSLRAALLPRPLAAPRGRCCCHLPAPAEPLGVP